MQTASNPLREGLTNRPQTKPCALVIFGATGDLTHRKLMPALYNLAADGDLPPGMAVIGFARRDKSDDVFRKEMEEATKKFSRQPVQQELWDHFAQNLFYHRSEFDNDEGYKSLAERIDKLDKDNNLGGRRMFYLAAGPEQFEPIISRLKNSGLNEPGAEGGWSRVGGGKTLRHGPAQRAAPQRGRQPARSRANTYRIDHFLGKETAQNIMVLRFANAIFEPIWNSRYIDHIEITAAETLGVEGARGLLRDERRVARHGAKPSHPTPDAGVHGAADRPRRGQRARRKGEGAAFAAPFKDAEDVKKNVVRGQYAAGAINGAGGARVPRGAERQAGVADGDVRGDARASSTTGVGRACRSTCAWANGCRRRRRRSACISRRRRACCSITQPRPTGGRNNVLVIRIQPDEGVSLRMQSKLPGAALRVEPVKMDFQYGASFGKASPEAYERLLLDAMSGDPTLFARRDEVEEAWHFVDAIENAWHAADGKAPELYEYAAGSWGPKEAEELIERDGRKWRRF